MDRRDFAKSLGVKAGALSALAAAPVGLMASSIPADAKTRDPGLLHLCRAILKQNLLKAGEMMVVATGYIFPEDYVAAMVQAGSEMGALVIHVPVHPKGTENGRLRPGLTGEHWRLYAQADLLIDVSYGRPAGVPAGTSGYGGKIGGAFTHEYPTDRAFIHREGSKTRWLLVHFEPAMQRILFANQARRARAIRGAELLHTANEVRIESEAGSDVTFGARGKQGHCQYGIADVPGRWDPYGTGCVAVAPVKTEAEGVLVFEPGDVLLQMNPQFLPEGEKIKLTFRGGEIVQVDGTRAAGLWDNLIQSYGHPDSLRVAHVGFGIHEATRQFRITRGATHPRSLYAYHHNDSGSFLFALGNNCGHGGGGKALNYSGLGMNADACGPNHTHFSFHGAGRNMWADDIQVVKDSELVPDIAGRTRY